jgi:hypothetical protein
MFGVIAGPQAAPERAAKLKESLSIFSVLMNQSVTSVFILTP